MPYQLNGKVLSEGQPFLVGDTQFCGNVLSLWSQQDLVALGLEWVEPAPEVLSIEAFCAAVDAERDRRLALDFPYDFGATPALDDNREEIAAGARLLQMRSQDQEFWTVLQGAALTAVVSGQPGRLMPMRAEDNWNIQTTATQVLQALSAMVAHGTRLVFYGGALKTAARQGADLSMLDYLSGWPEPQDA